MRAEWRSVVAELARPRDLHGTAHVGSAACVSCHPDNAASWHKTFHRTMTEDIGPARTDPVAGDFADATYSYRGVTTRMHRDWAGRYLMSFSGGRGGPAVEATVVRTVGSHRYQQYLTEVGGALWRLPLAYHVEERRWFHMNGAFLTPDPTPAELAAAPEPGHLRFGGGAFDRHVTRWTTTAFFLPQRRAQSWARSGDGDFPLHRRGTGRGVRGLSWRWRRARARQRASAPSVRAAAIRLGVHLSHRIEIPFPSADTAFGRPDACTLCHVDAPVRERALSALRAALPRAASRAPEPARLTRLRAEARRADIDIGE